MVVVLMGVSGSGKTTVGEILAQKLGWKFVEADDFHPSANVEKMRRGVPLTDEDRRPWLREVRGQIEELRRRGENAVLACSALKQWYRDYLKGQDGNDVWFVHLRGPEELIRQRLQQRQGHFFHPGLLPSQFDALEPPIDAIDVIVTPTPEAIADEIHRQLMVPRQP